MPRPIQDTMDELQAAVAAQTEVREKTLRNVSKSAKNIKHGDIVDLPHFGRVEINVWCRMGDIVCLGENVRCVSVPANERLRVIRR